MRFPNHQRIGSFLGYIFLLELFPGRQFGTSTACASFPISSWLPTKVPYLPIPTATATTITSTTTQYSCAFFKLLLEQERGPWAEFTHVFTIGRQETQSIKDGEILRVFVYNINTYIAYTHIQLLRKCQISLYIPATFTAATATALVVVILPVVTCPSGEIHLLRNGSSKKRRNDFLHQRLGGRLTLCGPKHSDVHTISF